jgi:alkylhydroperoxidase family enzyme
MSRIEPIPPRQWPPDMSKALAAAYRPSNPRHPVSPLDPSSPKGLNLMGTLAHHPELTTAYNNLISHALYFTTITPRQRELLVLRVAHVRGAPYEWAQHVYQASVVGISSGEVARVRVGADAEGWTPLERALLAAADELVTGACIDEATYAELSKELDTPQLMDVVFTVGVYDVLAMVLRTFEVELDDDLSDYTDSGSS